MTQELERTTVILPTFNRSAFLIEALESLFAQTLQPGEIIVVDDGSTDDTPERMAAYEGRIRYIRKANSGKANSLNQCMTLAQHPLIWIMDDDDLALPNALMAMTLPISGHPEIGLSYGRYERFSIDDNGQRHVRDCGYWSNADSDEFLHAILEDFFVHHPGLLVRRTAYDAVGPFSTKYGRTEDYEMMIRLARHFACAKTEEVVFLQRQHDGARFEGLAADRRNERWMEEGQGMLTSAYENLDLFEYLPRSQRTETLTPSQRRQTMIYRAGIMARHKLWSFAFADYRAACAVDGAQGPLSEEERGAIRRALFSKYGSPEVLADPEIAQGLRALSQEGPVGRAIGQTFARALLWFIRTRVQAGRFAEAARYAKLAVSLARSEGVRSDSVRSYA